MDGGRLRTYIADNPIAYAGFRAAYISDRNRETSTAENDEVPFIFSPFFVPLLFMYVLISRLQYVLLSRFGLQESRYPSAPDHIFVMTSDHHYRTYAFEKVGERLVAAGEHVMFVCSPSATDKMKELDDRGFRAESFNHLLHSVSIYHSFIDVFRSALVMYRITNLITDRYPDPSYVFVYNSIFLESIKVQSLLIAADGNPAIHSYSLMPYQVECTIPERLFVYQHGVQRTPDEDTWAATSFFPANILIWGEAWFENFEDLVHPESNIVAVGSPWFDRLSEMVGDSRANERDVIFIGGSQSTTTPERNRLYTNMVGSLVEICEEHGWSLAIKLHPIESRTWYEERGWDHYIEDFTGIHDALGSSAIAVTHFSSAFVESIVMGTPIILDEAWSQGLERARPIQGAKFVDTNGLEEAMEEWLDSGNGLTVPTDRDRLVDVGGSIDRILEVVSVEP